MVNVCCVPGCKTGYKCTKTSYPVMAFSRFAPVRKNLFLKFYKLVEPVVKIIMLTLYLKCNCSKIDNILNK